MRRIGLGALTAAAVVAWGVEAGAATPLDETRSDGYYGLNLGLTAAGVLGGVGFQYAYANEGPRYDLRPFCVDDFVRQNFSQTAAATSDGLLLLTVATPMTAQVFAGTGTSFGNATMIYAEAQSANFFLFSMTKSLVRRPRPYTHALDPRIQEFADQQGTDAYRSFYSGHASTAFTSAMAGSILYAMRSDDSAARHVMWGFEFGLAGVVTHLRVVAGRHYRTDVLVGGLAGVALGLGIPAAHGMDLGRIEGTEWGLGVGAALLGAVGSEAVSFCDLLSMDCAPRDVKVPTPPGSDRHTDDVSYMVMPMAYEGGGGLGVMGMF